MATFTVTLASAGTYALSLTNAAGAVLGTQTLTVGSEGLLLLARLQPLSSA